MSSSSAAQYEAGFPNEASAEYGEAELLRKAQRGDRAAFGMIVRRHQDRLFNAVLRLVGDPEEARELTQETFARALEKLDSFRGDAGAYTWLFRIAMNLGISQLRKVRRHRIFSLDGSPGSGDGQAQAANQASGLLDRASIARSTTPAQAVEGQEQRQQVLAALGRLDPDARALLVMRDVEGFDYQQMADLLDLPLGTLKSRLFRARLALREELKGYMQM